MSKDALFYALIAASVACLAWAWAVAMEVERGQKPLTPEQKRWLRRSGAGSWWQ